MQNIDSSDRTSTRVHERRQQQQKHNQAKKCTIEEPTNKQIEREKEYKKTNEETDIAQTDRATTATRNCGQQNNKKLPESFTRPDTKRS